MNQKRRKSKILVAMSGGVDSSVAAALLKKAGFDVVGAFMKLNNFSSESEARARKVASIIGIPFYVFNFKKEFKKKIVDYFLKEYKAGRTPNPCVVCNKEIKFGLLVKKALVLGADYIATGHYVRIKKTKDGFSLMKAKDRNKDQSYFLWKLNQKQLSRILFPVGSYMRTEVEKMAKILNLPFLNVKKSMEICFVPKTIESFLKKYLKTKKGKIVNEEGVVIGRHEGTQFYTVGQRKGIKLPEGPFYVLAKDSKKNILVVTKYEKLLLKKEIFIKNVSWISGKESKLPMKVSVKIRYRSQSASAVIYKLQATSYKLIFSSPQRAVTPGQSAVFYKGDQLLGGGIII